MGSGLSGKLHTQIRGMESTTGRTTGKHGPPPSCGTHVKGLDAKVDPVTCGGAARQSVKRELLGATARGQPVQPTLDMAMVAWVSGVRMGA